VWIVSTHEPDPFERLFRDPATPASAPDPELIELAVFDEPEAEQVAIHEQESVEDVIVDEVNVDEVIVSEASSDELLEVADGVVAVSDREGRLYRSVGAEHLPEAIPALTTSQAGRLRTVRKGGPRATDHGSPEIVRIAEDVAAPGSLMVIDEMAPAAQPVQEFAPRPAPLTATKKDGTLTALGVYALVLLVPTIVALLQAFIFGSAPNAITGIVMIIVAAAAALLVRGADDVTAILAPPIGFLLITLTAGQVNLNASSITGRLVDVFFTLGNNWMWIVGSTGIALLIVALRRRRA
jgi:hypothetical protein